MSTLTMKKADGGTGAERRAPRRDLRHRAQRRGDAPGRHRAARRQARRHAQHQDARRGARRWREAVAPEGHRPRPPGLDPLAAVARRRCGARPEAARLLAADAQEDGAARAALARSPTARPRARSSSSTTGASTSRRPRTGVKLLEALGLRTKGERGAARACSCCSAPRTRCGSRCATSASVCRSSCPKS